MKIAFIFAFVLLCGLAFCEERAEFEDEIADVADPKGHCKSSAHTVNSFLFASFIFDGYKIFETNITIIQKRVN